MYLTKDIFLEYHKEYVVEVHGWVMLKDLPEGTYKIVINRNRADIEVCHFYKLRGKRRIVSLYLSDVFITGEDNPNNNKIVFKGGYTGSVHVVSGVKKNGLGA